MEDILINWSPQETRVAVVENGAVQELHIERTLERGLVGNVYLGKVARVLPGMQSAFIDIGLERAAFLHVADLHLLSGQRCRSGLLRCLLGCCSEQAVSSSLSGCDLRVCGLIRGEQALIRGTYFA